MKQIVIIFFLILGINITIIAQLRSNITIPTIQLALSSDQKLKLKNLVAQYKRQISDYYNIINNGYNTRYMHQTEKFFNHRKTMLLKKITQTIDAIKKFYTDLGFNTEKVLNEEKKLKQFLYY